MSDKNFVGTDDDSLPDASLDFSCKSEPKEVNPEVVVDVKQDDQWVRIPVTGVEEWVNKDGPADMSRTAKVMFPMVWGGHTIAQYINGFNSQNALEGQEDPYDECRIFFYDHELDEWVITHYGYVGGIGPTDETGVGKMWVYDAADLMKGIKVSQSFAEPSLGHVINFALRGEDQQGNAVGIERRSVFENVDVEILGKENIPSKKRRDLLESGAYQLQTSNLIDNVFNWIEQNTDFDEEIIDPLLGGQKRFQINRHNMVDYMEWFTSLIDARWWFEPSENGPILVIDATAFKFGQEKGNYERRYFVDDEAVDDWREVQEQARAETFLERLSETTESIESDKFETYGSETVAPPNKETFNLNNVSSDNAPSDDIFVISDEVPDDYLPPHNYDIFTNVDILQNNALVDIKPFNTLTLYGESQTFRERYGSYLKNTEDDEEASTAQNFREAAAAGAYTEEYPEVTVTYEPLVQRAGGYEYSAQPIESDKVYLEEARNQAVKEFRKHLAEETEGQMTLYGEPHIMPFDYIVSLPVCDGNYLNADTEPIAWEVNGVKHVRKAGERYKTELGVSMTVEDRLFDVEAKYREA